MYLLKSLDFVIKAKEILLENKSECRQSHIFSLTMAALTPLALAVLVLGAMQEHWLSQLNLLIPGLLYWI